MSSKKKPKKNQPSAYIENAGVVIEQEITDTLETNFMPYAMSVIVSRAIPEIDGFKPSHRKLLYTMYKMGLLTGNRTKSANIVGQTMRLNPHGDATIYETMVRMSRGYEVLLHPYVDSKGNFGKAYSRDMAYAAPRYTEAKLAPISRELFADIDMDTVDFVDNYDNTTKEPVLFPVTYPSVLVNSNMGIAVGMASSICSFNLEEVCKTTQALMKDPNHDILTTLKAPDFAGGGYVVYDEKLLRRIYDTGRGSIRLRAKYRYVKKDNCIEIYEIPATTTVEAIIDRVAGMVRDNDLREVVDMRDETDLNGLKITIDLRRGTNPDELMQRLYRSTTLEDTFSCNFNILIGNQPRVMGVGEIIEEWLIFRRDCIRRRVSFSLVKQQEKLHLLEGLEKILMDIDKAIRIVRETEEEKNVIPNLMEGFGIDEQQADYVAEIRLRHLNREYILNRIQEIDKLTEEIEDMESILKNPRRINTIINRELNDVMKKYGQKRRTEVYELTAEDKEEIVEEIPDYPVHLFFTKEGYFKKIVPQSLRMSSNQQLKDGDTILQQIDTTNDAELLFFTNHHEVYKAHAYDFEDTRASAMGDYVPAELEMEEGEYPIYMCATKDFAGYMMFFFENGKAAKVVFDGYETKTKRRKLMNAYSDRSPLIGIFYIEEDQEFLIHADNKRTLIFDTSAMNSVAARDSVGVQVLTLRSNTVAEKVYRFTPKDEEENTIVKNGDRFRNRTVPHPGFFQRPEDQVDQITFDEIETSTTELEEEEE